MSSLRDIMDVDVEPLPQSLRKSTREHNTPDDTTTDQLTPSTQEQHGDDQGKAAIKRRKSSRSGQASASEASSTQGESSTTVASMDPNPYGPGSHRGASGTSSTRHSSRSSDVPEGTVKYTPVTGRVSRAKKGQPVHVCEICKPSKTFTRAEHLRRHQLSHTKPAFPCTFQDCERAFHRPDLLARHQNRHETQGEKAFKASKARSRASSADSEQRLGTPLLRPDDQSKPSSASPSESMNPRASAGPTAPNSATLSPPFTSAKIESPSPSGEPSYRAGRQNDAAVGIGEQFEQFRDSVPAADDMLSQYHVAPRNVNHGFYNEQSLFHIPTNYQFGSYQAAEDFPSSLQLQIPEQPYPGLCMQDNTSSPWYGSESPYSTPSDRTGRSWGEYRDRSVSIATVPDIGYAHPSGPWSPHRASSTQRNSIHSRSPNMGSLSEQPEELSYLPPGTAPQMAVSPQIGYTVESGSVRGSSRSPNHRVGGQPMGYQHPKTVVSIEPIDGYQLGWRAGAFQGQLEPYISAFWRFFDSLWPIIHRPTFNPDASPPLRLAMAAIGTQFCGRAIDREIGSELHRECKKLIGLSSSPDIHTIQAILFTEVFARFRSQKIDIQPSKAFKALYDYLLEKLPYDNASPFSRFDSDSLHSLLTNGSTTNDVESDIHTPIKTRVWHEWISYEIRQRLRAACFMFVVHQSLYFDNGPSHPDKNVQAQPIIFPCSDEIWQATDAEEWYSKIIAKGASEETMENSEIEQSHYQEHLLICSLLSILPHRDLSKLPAEQYADTGVYTNPMIAHGYLQFYHSPLRDILAITGDTWVFGRKVKTQTEFEQTKRRLYTWSTSLQAAKATWHACHVLKLAFTQTQNSETNDSDAACAYWSVYTAALICWAFGHRKAYSSVGDEKTSDPDAMAIAYVDLITGSKWQDLLSMPSTRGELAVVHVVKQRLELEGLGGKCGMLADATAVLTRISEGRGGKWF